MEKRVSSLLEKEMSRQQFLTIVGLGIASLLGFSSILRLLGKKGYLPQHGQANGYGSTVYGK